MPMYEFHLFPGSGIGSTLDAVEFRNDATAFRHAGALLDEHASCDHVDVWKDSIAVVARHRDRPVIRPVFDPADPDGARWKPVRRPTPGQPG